jgi:predicted nucleic acid-binding protein
MIVVSNTSPLINLANIGQLHLLKQLYGEVIIPPAVYDEIVIAGGGQPGAMEGKIYDWVKVEQISNQQMGTLLQIDVDIGEAEAIVLALEMKPDLLLLDERKGRQVASNLGIKFTGILGILIEAKNNQLINAIKPIMDDLIKQVGFRISSKLYQRVLQIANEQLP